MKFQIVHQRFPAMLLCYLTGAFVLEGRGSNYARQHIAKVFLWCIRRQHWKILVGLHLKFHRFGNLPPKHDWFALLSTWSHPCRDGASSSIYMALWGLPRARDVVFSCDWPLFLVCLSTNGLCAIPISGTGEKTLEVCCPTTHLWWPWVGSVVALNDFDQQPCKQIFLKP